MTSRKYARATWLVLLASAATAAVVSPATVHGQTEPPSEVTRTPMDTAAVGAAISYEQIERLDPWVMVSAYRTFVPQWGTAVARLTGGQRFGSTGVQGEVEAYPRMGRVGYLYAAAALSPNEEVFVPLRAALELFGSPTASIELSGGARLFRAASRTIVAYTGSIGGYSGNYWYAFRPYVVKESGSLSTTGLFSLRRYGAGRHDYVGIHLSGTRGADPTVDDPSRLSRDPDLTTFSVRVERLRPIRDGRARLGFGLGLESEEVAQSERRLHVLLTFRLERLLR